MRPAANRSFPAPAFSGQSGATHDYPRAALGPVPVTFCIALRMFALCSLPLCGAIRLLKAEISSQRAAKPSSVRSSSGSQTASFITVQAEW